MRGDRMSGSLRTLLNREGRPARQQATQSRGARKGRILRKTPPHPSQRYSIARCSPELRERPGLRRGPAPAPICRASLRKSGPCPTRGPQPERPGVRRLVAECLLALGRGEVRGDRDPVRRAVHDLAARELAAERRTPRRVEPEARREAVVRAAGGGPRRRARRSGRERAHARGVHGNKDNRDREEDLCSDDSWRLSIVRPGGLRSRSRGAGKAGKMVSYPSGSETVSGYLAAPGGFREEARPRSSSRNGGA